MTERDSLALLTLQSETSFVLSPTGRMLRVNDPPAGKPPLAWAGMTGDGLVLRFGVEVPAEVASSVETAVSEVPRGSRQEVVGAIETALGGTNPAVEVEHGLTWELPHGLDYEDAIDVISWGTDQGRRLLDRLDREMPATLLEAGFVDTDEFWPPWCVAMEGDAIAAIAFAARLGTKAADLGLYTFPGFRGRGIGAALTAAWTNHPALEDRTLFYSTSVENVSSQRVVERLGLPFVGWTAEFR